MGHLHVSHVKTLGGVWEGANPWESMVPSSFPQKSFWNTLRQGVLVVLQSALPSMARWSSNTILQLRALW